MRGVFGKWSSNAWRCAIAFGAATALAGCIAVPQQSTDSRFGGGIGGGFGGGGFGGGPAGPGGAPAVEGSWASSDGAAIATFQNGAFINRAVDTGQAFTSGGRYTYAGGNQVSISYLSVVRQEPVNVNCLVVTPSQMNCTNNQGSQFSLFRRA